MKEKIPLWRWAYSIFIAFWILFFLYTCATKPNFRAALWQIQLDNWKATQEMFR